MGRRNAVQLEAHRKEQAVYQDKYPEQYRETWKKTRQGKHDFIAEVVGTVCVRCYDDRDNIIEYHHPNGGGGQTRGLYDMSFADLQEEAMLLIPLCGTCHNIDHGGR